MSIQIAEISQRLQSALDSSYNVSITKFIMFSVCVCVSVMQISLHRSKLA